MSQEQAKQYILQGINAARAGQKDQARQLFQNAIKLDPQNETAWAWMSTVAKDNRERQFCFQNLLQINPQNEVALKGLRQMGVDPASLQQKQPAAKAAPASTPASGAASVPVLPSDRLNAIMPSIDEFIRAYNPIPVGMGEGTWEQKKSGLYGVAAARRRQMQVYGALGAVGLVVLAILAFALVSLLSGGEATQEAAFPTFRSTLTPTPTATATPGITNTPSPEPANPLPTFEPPANLIEGDRYGGTPTPFYPDIPPGAGRDFENAVNEYSIRNYTDAFSVFERRQAEAEGSNIDCNAQAYYYHAVGLAELGGRQNLQDANALIGRAVARPLCVETNEALGLLNTAACYVGYIEGLEAGSTSQYGEAASLCEDAIQRFAPQPPMVLAVTTLAKIYIAQQNYDAAANVLEDALAPGRWPNDINLMLARAEVELARARLDVALEYISRALYVEPTSEPALRLRVEAFLRTAEQESNRQQQIQLYGTAVIWTQEYLLFHPGDPDGYLLMAKARLGEGNLDFAEEALDRIISVRRELPESEQPVVLEAYRLRSQIYEQSARFEAAFEDVELLLGQDTDETDFTLLQRRMNLAYQLGNYTQVLEDIATLLEQDTASDPNALQLIRLKLITEVCEFENSIECDYPAVQETTTDEFLEELTPEQRVEALSYRAKAQYHLTLANEELSQNERNRQYQAALSDLSDALEVNENGLDLYYRGLLQEALEETADAIRTYQYILYWSQFYNYPFIEDVQSRIETLQESEAT